MYNSHRSHPLLSQIPLTVSPFISLPAAPTLPYTYRPLPSTLPPSSTADANGVEREKYVVAPSGHTAHPDEIIASCQTLQAHIVKVQEDAEQFLRDWEKELKEQELAEKRRVAPGWLDRDEKILEPERASPAPISTSSAGLAQDAGAVAQQNERRAADRRTSVTPKTAAEELNLAFGGMGLQNR